MKAARCALTTPTMSWSALKTYALTTLDIEDLSTQIKWNYNAKPTGGSTSPYRLHDFAGYSKDALPTFKIPTQYEKYVTLDGFGKCYWTLDLSQTQTIQGIKAGDLFAGTGYHLGVMFIDYEDDANTIALIAANSANIESNQTVTVDITDIRTSSYLICFFVYLDDYNAGLAQINNPTESQLSQYLSYLIPLENGIVPSGIQNRYHFPFRLWGYSRIYPHIGSFKSSFFYNLYRPGIPYGNSPIHWDSYTNWFYIESPNDFNVFVEWSLSFKFYKYTNTWEDDYYYHWFSYRDVDLVMMSIFLKTVSGVIYIKFSELNGSPIFELNTGKTLSELDSAPNSLKIYKYYNSYNIPVFDITIDGDTFTPYFASGGHMTQDENPPDFFFGRNEDSPAPRGLD